MTFKELLPNFDDPKLQALVDVLEREFIKREYRTRTQNVVSASSHQCRGVDEVIHVDYTATGTVTITLPSPSLFVARPLVIYDRGNNASVNNVTINSGMTTIYTISTDKECVTLSSDGSNWFIESKS